MWNVIEVIRYRHEEMTLRMKVTTYYFKILLHISLEVIRKITKQTSSRNMFARLRFNREVTTVGYNCTELA